MPSTASASVRTALPVSTAAAVVIRPRALTRTHVIASLLLHAPAHHTLHTLLLRWLLSALREGVYTLCADRKRETEWEVE